MNIFIDFTGQITHVADVTQSEFIVMLVQLAAYIVPFFLIPAAFKVGMGAFGALTGMLSDKSRGFFDKQRKYRQGKYDGNKAAMKNFSRFGDRGLGRVANTGLGALTNGKVRPSSIRAARMSGYGVQGAGNLENDKVFQANKNDDKFLVALADRKLAKDRLTGAMGQRNQALSDLQSATTDGARAAAQERLNNAQADVDARERGLRAAGQVQSRHTKATQAAAFDAWTKTGYEVSAGQQGYEEIRTAAQRISGGDAGSMSTLMNQAQFNLKGAGRSDLGGINNGASLNVKSGIRKLNSYQRGQGKADTYTAGAQAWLGSSGDNLSAESISASIANESSGVSQADVLEYHDMLSRDFVQATDGNRIEIEKQRRAIETALGSDPTIAQQLQRQRAARGEHDVNTQGE